MVAGIKTRWFQRFEQKHICKNGNLIPVEIESNYIIFEGFGYNVCFVRDITERKKFEKANEQLQAELERRVEKRTEELAEQRKAAIQLAEENEFIRFAVENASVAFFLINKDAEILRVNTAACTQTGFTKEELVGMCVGDLDPDFPMEAWPMHWKDLQENKHLRFETIHRHKDGRIIPKEVEANYVEFEGKGYNFGFVRDISERKEWSDNKEKLQAELEKQVDQQMRTMDALKKSNHELTRSNEELDKFAFAASHDLKSPLFAIHNLVDMIEEDASEVLTSDALKSFNKLKRRVQHMEDLLESLLSYSRVGNAEDIPSEQSTLELLESIITLLGMPQQVKIDIPHDMPKLTAPRGALLRVFHNLISNSIKHGGRIDLHIKVRWQDLGEELQFTISDNGKGIDSQHHERVFEMFKTLEPSHNTGSSGMGLALVKKTVFHYGGNIYLESQPGEGTAVTFTWPKYRPSAETST